MKQKTKSILILLLGVLVFALILCSNKVQATTNTIESINNSKDTFLTQNELISGLIDNCEVFTSWSGAEPTIVISISPTKMYELLTSKTILKQNLKKDNYVYDYFYIKVPQDSNNASVTYNSNNATENLEIIKINGIQYVKCPYPVALFADNDFYPGFVYCEGMTGDYASKKRSGYINFKNNNEIIEKVPWRIEYNYEEFIDFENVNWNLSIESESGKDYSIGGAGNEDASGWNYDRQLAKDNPYVKLSITKKIGETVNLKYFGTLKYIGIEKENDNTYYIYKAPITDKSIFNRNSIGIQLLEYKSLHLHSIGFKGDLISIDKTVSKADETTNIKLNTNTDVVPADTILECKPIKEGTTYNTVKTALEKVAEKFTAYDITLTSNGVKVQPNGKVQISIPVPQGYNTSKILVYRIADNGEKTKYDVTVKDNYITFETNHFSTYVVAEEKTETVTPSTPSVEKTPSNEKDNTPKTGTNDIISYISIITIISALGIIAIRKRK